MASMFGVLDDLTYSCWIRTSTAGVYGQYEVTFGGYSNAGAGWDLGKLWTPYGTTDLTFPVAGATKLNDGVWHHVATTFNDSTKAINYYLDGQLDASTTWPSYVTHFAITIGAGNASSYFNFTGNISNCVLHDSELTQAQVETLYNNGTPQLSPSFSPYGWWKCDNLTTGIEDSAGSNNGTNNGATETQTNVWTPRLNGESTTLPSTALVSSDLQFESPYSNFSLDFDGADDYIDIGQTDITGTKSVSFWIYPTASGDDGGIFSMAASGATSDFLSVGLWQSNIQAVTQVGYKQRSTQTISVNSWYHIVVVKTTNSIDNIYINGVNQTLDSAGTWNGTLDNPQSKLGQATFSGSSFNYTGKLDECAIFNKALTQSEISQVYNNGYAADLTSLSPVSWWRLGEDAYFVSPNFTVPNQITGAPNGTSQNMTQADLVANAPGSYASGIGSSLALADRVGDAPESTANSLSFNMTPLNKISYPSGYVPTQVDNVYSMDFDGTSDYVLTGLAPASYTGFSISAWVYADSLGAYNVVASQYRNSDATNSAWFLETIGSDMAFGVGSGGSALYATKAFSTSGWYHITGVWNGSTVEVYIDGVASGSPVSATSMNTGTVNMGIGALWNTAGTAIDNGFWNGKIDEVAIFDYALSERQIKQDIYEGTTTGKTADLNNISNLTAPVAWYRMGD